MPKRLTYIVWSLPEEDILRRRGPHLSTKKLVALLGNRHTYGAVAAKLRHMHIRRTPERRQVAASEGILGAAARQLQCCDCGSRKLEIAPKVVEA